LKRLLILSSLLVALCGGCSGPDAPSLGDILVSGQAAGHDVLLVTLDTVRQDRLGCYGYERAETPVLDALAAGGALFHDCVASAPLTLPSHTTILTGQSPATHGVRDNGLYALEEDASTLAEDLHAAGYATAAFIAAFVMDARYGLDQGFDLYDFQVGASGGRSEMAEFNERPADEVTDAALAWLGRRHTNAPEQPVFAWVHYFDPHMPYTSPLQGRPKFRGRGYDAEIAFVDQQLGRLIDWLDANGRRDRTLIVVVADHGESLGEHGEEAHGMFIYNATMKVPLIINSRSLITSRLDVRDRIVGLVDLRDTIGDLVGVAPSGPTDGQSLLDPVDPDRRIYMETECPLNMAGCSPLFGLQSREEKYIRAPVPEFYDLATDPNELANLYEERSDRLDPWVAELADLMVEEVDGAERRLSEEEIQRLRSLGYTHASRPDRDGDLPDPKDVVVAFHQGMDAEDLYFQGRHAEAAALAQRAVDGCPSCIAAIRVLAFSKLRLGEGEAAVAILDEAVERTGDLFLMRSQAQAQIIVGDPDGAFETLERFAVLDPNNGWLYLLRGDIHEIQGRPEQALAEYRRALELDGIRIGDRARRRIEKLETP